MCGESGHEAGDMSHCLFFLKAYIDKCCNEKVEPNEKFKKLHKEMIVQAQRKDNNNINVNNMKIIEAKINSKVATSLFITKALYGDNDTNQTCLQENLLGESFNDDYRQVKQNYKQTKPS